MRRCGTLCEQVLEAPHGEGGHAGASKAGAEDLVKMLQEAGLALSAMGARGFFHAVSLAKFIADGYNSGRVRCVAVYQWTYLGTRNSRCLGTA